jgi:hypothetical protein
MKKILVFLLMTILLIPTVACQSDANQQKSEMLEYLRSGVVTLNSLPQAFQTAVPAKDLSTLNPQGVSAVLAENIGKYQNGLQTVKAEKVPDIPDAKSFHETTLSLVQDVLNNLKKMQAALNSKDQAAWAQAVDEYNTIIPRVSTYYRLIESLLKKHNISDSEVDYQFRGK